MYVKRLTESPALELVQSARWARSCSQSLHVHNKVFCMLRRAPIMQKTFYFILNETLRNVKKECFSLTSGYQTSQKK